MRNFIFLYLLLGTSQQAYAYLDSGTGSMLLQILFGGLAGILVIMKTYWYRLKSFFVRDKSQDNPSKADKEDTKDQSPNKNA